MPSQVVLNKQVTPQFNLQLDWQSDLSVKLIETYLSNDIKSISTNIEKYGVSCFSKKNLTIFLQKLENNFISILNNIDPVKKELFLLYEICNGLNEYNNKHQVLEYITFRSKILFPNLIFILVKYYKKAQSFLQKTIRTVYNEYNTRHSTLINKFINSYYLDENIIKSDVLYKFLGSGLKNFNPLEINNITNFYRHALRNTFYYHFKSDYNFNSSYIDIGMVDTEITKNKNIPVRLIYYRNVLYNLQIKRMCKQSATLNQLTYNYNIFKNIIINNEFQDMYYSLNQDSFMAKNNQFKIMKLYSHDTDRLLEELKKLPLIYKLLRSIHILNQPYRSDNPLQIKPGMLKLIVLEELLYPFKNFFAETYITKLLEKIADNFTTSVLNGEYINPITFSEIDIYNYSFTNQLKQFIRLCFRESGVIR